MVSAGEFSDLSVLIVGHITLDLRGTEILLGGPPQYHLPILLAYGVGRIDILTSCSDPTVIPNHPHVQIFNVTSQHTTTFSFHENDSKEGEDDRILVLEKNAVSFNKSHLEGLRDNYDIIIISGVCGEVPMDFLSELSHIYEKSFIAVDAQTICRDFSETERGTEVINKPVNYDLIIRLESIIKRGLLKGSSIELPNLDRLKLSNPNFRVIKTSSGRNLEILQNYVTGSYQLTMVEDSRIVDTTGSGDIFLASILMEYEVQSEDEKLAQLAVERAHEITKNHLFINGIPAVDTSRTIVNQVRQSFSNKRLFG